MFDIKSFYEAKDVADAINALVKNPDAEIISGGTAVSYTHLDVYKRQVSIPDSSTNMVRYAVSRRMSTSVMLS